MKLSKLIPILIALLPMILEIIEKLETLFDCPDEPVITG